MNYLNHHLEGGFKTHRTVWLTPGFVLRRPYAVLGIELGSAMQDKYLNPYTIYWSA